MKLFRQLAIIFFLCLVGQGISQILPFAFPSSIISMILLLILLLTKLLKSNQIQDVADFLLKNMAFFFIPDAVGILENIGLLQGKLVGFFIICFVSTLVTFGVGAGVANLCIYLQKKWGGTQHE